MARVEMQYQNESHAAVGGHIGKELLERFQSARGSSDANNERVSCLFSRGGVEFLPEKISGVFFELTVRSVFSWQSSHLSLYALIRTSFQGRATRIQNMTVETKRERRIYQPR